MPKQTDSIELTNSLQGTVEYTASQEIIPEEKILQHGSFTYTTNGERTENPSEGYDGFDTVGVNVNVQPALQEKSVSYTDNGDNVVEADDGYYGLSRVNVNVDVPQGGGEAPENDVEFIDYDGTIVYSYTAQEFLALDAMPANPTHEGLTAQGWNWSLTDAKEYVTDVGGLIIGQMYITDDEKTRIYITLLEGRTSPYLGIAVNGTVNVDWGDGTNEDVTGTSEVVVVFTQHSYSNAGDYIIKLNPSGSSTVTFYRYSNSYLIGSLLSMSNNINNMNQNYAYLNCIKKIETGKNLVISYGGLYFCRSLETITMNSQVSLAGEDQFNFCSSLRGIVMPSNSSYYKNMVSNTSLLKRISLSKRSASLTQCALGAPSVNYLTTYWNYTNGQQTCWNAKKAKIIRTYGGTSLPQNYFAYAQSAEKIIFSSKTTKIGNSCFSDCISLVQLTIPNRVTSIGSSAFNNCYALSKLKFEPSTPPVVDNSNAFTGVPTDCKIYVPYSADHSVLNAYKTATNYPNPSTYTYVEY